MECGSYFASQVIKALEELDITDKPKTFDTVGWYGKKPECNYAQWVWHDSRIRWPRYALAVAICIAFVITVPIVLLITCMSSPPVEPEETHCWERTIILNDTVSMRWFVGNAGLDLATVDSIVLTQWYYGPCCEQAVTGIWEEKWGFR